MTTWIIPTSTDPEVARYTQSVALDGRDYELGLRWNQREKRWYFSLADQDGTPIVSGRKVVADWDLLRGITTPRRPPGLLTARDTLGEGKAPGLTDLGARVKLVYLDLEELAIVAAERAAEGAAS